MSKTDPLTLQALYDKVGCFVLATKLVQLCMNKRRLFIEEQTKL
jgi:hypothetical protein